ncbi:GNAT family N-acetyltransferase [Sandarakinorhabdus sp.]|uniref:GNAT family N-acetyltransferase n=1 Tax=Sandarakinorhabdus sp. TaxID=1916663 RepID=UPI00286E4EAB|nr:GNAT family N-acetyltransferase [Sandarakinorhabdus sp.]
MIETQRLILRPWRDDDLAPFAAMGRDPRVMAHFPTLMNEVQSKAMAVRIMNHIGVHKFGAWAMERKSDRRFIGFCGLSRVEFQAPVKDEIEIGWRLAHQYWGQGYVHEAAHASLAHGFETLALPRIVSFTVPGNTRSWGLMQRLGMDRAEALDFEHPALPPGHPLRPHVVYVKATQSGGS